MARILSEAQDELLDTLLKLSYRSRQELPAGEPIRVSNITRGLGFFYERIRNALDYHEEHLWAKNAIFRVLKRRFYEILGGKKIGRSLLEELIRGHYLENNTVPEGWAFEIEDILAKYRQVFLVLEQKYRSETREAELRELEMWFLALGAVEIEEALQRSHNDRPFIAFFYKVMKEHLEIAAELRIDDLDLELYLASYRNFLLADEIMEAYTLFRLYFPEWERRPTRDLISDIADDLGAIKVKIGAKLKNPVRLDLDRIFKRRSLLVFLLRDLIAEDPEAGREILLDPEALERKLRQLYDERYRTNRIRLQRSAGRAVIFIFLTKMLLALLLEIPYELVKTTAINFVALAFNTFIPPLILIGAAIAIRMPGEEQNFLQLVVDFEKIITSSGKEAVLDILKPKKKRSVFQRAMIIFLYVVNFVITFSLLGILFKVLKFNWVSGVLFVFFLSLVSFFGLRLRKTANELAAVEEKEDTLITAAEFLAFPIIEIGRLLAEGLRAINVIALVFDFFIEAPFKTFVEVLEEWFAFVRERKQSL